MSKNLEPMKVGNRMKPRAWGWLALTALGLALAALVVPSCVQKGLGPPSTLAVSSRSPAPGGSNVARTAIITIEFNAPVLPSTVTSSTLTLSTGGTLVPSTVTFQACNRIATLSPNAPLAASTLHTVSVTTGIADPNGRSVNPDSFTFTTGASADVTRPIFGGATSVTSPDVPTTTIPGSPVTVIPGTPVTSIPPIPGTGVPGGTFPGSTVIGPGSVTPGTPTSSVTPGTPTSTVPTGTSTGSGILVSTPAPTAPGTEASGASTVLFAVATLSATLFWSPATDDQDPSSALVYDVFTTTMSGCYNFGVPTFTTAPGATSATLSNLISGISHFFVVRARDTAGNEDQNTQEVSLISIPKSTISFLNDVWPIVLVHCQSCHTQGVGAQQVPDMILASPAETFAAWVGVTASCPLLPPGTFRVRSGNHLSSFLWQKVTMDVPPCGARMPMSAPPLSDQDQQTIQFWIDQGAHNN
jgi:hypothetical protein